MRLPNQVSQYYTVKYARKQLSDGEMGTTGGQPTPRPGKDTSGPNFAHLSPADLNVSPKMLPHKIRAQARGPGVFGVRARFLGNRGRVLATSCSGARTPGPGKIQILLGDQLLHTSDLWQAFSGGKASTAKSWYPRGISPLGSGDTVLTRMRQLCGFARFDFVDRSSHVL